MRVVLSAGADIIGAVRGYAGDSVVVMLAGDLDEMALALARAALGPLAVERAPRRVNAVHAMAGADPADVAAAADFLEHAASTTGQWLEVGQRTVR